MYALPMKPEYGPTLGRLLSPRWRAASRSTRVLVSALGVALLAAAVAAALALLDASYSHGGRVPFSFSYRGLYRVSPEPGEYVKVQRRHSDGRLADSFAVAPLRLPPYSGELAAELPLYAEGYIRALARRDAAFVLRGEGKTRVNGLFSAYDVLYTAYVEGHRLFGRDVLLLPERRGARDGVAITMLSTTGKGTQASSPMEIASTGVLARPLKSFTFG